VRASPLFRLTAFWALLVFGFGWGGDALVLHPCPHHSAISHAGGHMGHAGGHHSAAGRDERDGHGAPPSHAGGCSCIVACAGTADALAAAPASVRLAHGAVRVVRIAAARHGAVLPGRLEYLLPYSTAPPSVPS
jgi:hypothetical protein